MKIGYFLSSEEYAPAELVEQAKQAEQAGFHALWISDHYHPWNDEQGHSGVRLVGDRRARRGRRACPVTTGVTCPTVRIHPGGHRPGRRHQRASCSTGRFTLGVGTGEALNEHILGDRWPEADVRLEMLEEAVEVMRALWRAAQQSHHGLHYTVENARIYDLPDDAAADLRLRLRPEGDRARGAHRRRLRDHVPGQGRDRPLPRRGRHGPGARRHQGLLRPRRGGGARRPRTGCGRTRRCPASSPRSCRRRRTSSRRASWSRPTSSARRSARTSTSTSSRCKEYEEAGVDELFVQQIGPEQDLFFD